MSKTLVILGSTGSIGTQAIKVCRRLGLEIKGLTAGTNKELLYEQALELRPEMISIADEKAALELARRLKAQGLATQVLSGRAGNLAAASWPGADTVLAAMVGVAGLEPVLAAVRAGKKIALANKETLVAGGQLVMAEAKKSGSLLYPVDSEHSAIWQCLAAVPAGSLSKIFLTASGGPFRGRSQAQLAHVTKAEALAHPTWQMGGKISIDSATLMNKGLEVIEAHWLFDCPAENIEVVVHPQSIIHSMIELKDGSVLAQLGFPDMELPIQLALTWPERLPTAGRPYDPFASSPLTFEPPDLAAFPLLGLAYAALKEGGLAPAVLNAANEAAVNSFLAGRCTFNDIARLTKACLDLYLQKAAVTQAGFDAIMEQDSWARKIVYDLVAGDFK